MTHNTPEAGTAAVQRGHEIFDLDLRYVRWFSVAVVVLLVFTAAAAFTMLGGFRLPPPRIAAAQSGAESASNGFATLQSAPQDELRAYRRSKSSSLEGYRWIDRPGGVIQIPIERAMELVAAQSPTPVSAPAGKPKRSAALPSGKRKAP